MLSKCCILVRNTFLNVRIGAMKDPQDHRIRVAAERKYETQERLPLSGLYLSSNKPTKGISIQEIYTHAETDRLVMVC